MYDRLEESTIDAEESFILPVFDVDSFDIAGGLFDVIEREHVAIAGEDEHPCDGHASIMRSSDWDEASTASASMNFDPNSGVPWPRRATCSA